MEIRARLMNPPFVPAALNANQCPACFVEGKWDAVSRHCWACGLNNPVPGRFKTFLRLLFSWD